MLLNDERRDAYLSLSETGLPAEAATKLAALGISTLEELRDAWTYGNRQLLTDYLGESPVRFTMVRPSASLTRGAASRGPGDSINLMAAGPARPLVRHARGLALTATLLRRPAEAPGAIPPAGRRGGAGAALARPVSLIDRFPAVRDQGQRGTCVAFATAAYLEFHLSGGQARTTRRSEQFLYWACKETDGDPTGEGTTLSAVRRVLKSRGACRNVTWKYQSLPIGPTEGQGPPGGALDEAKQARRSQTKDVAAGDIAAIRKRIDDGHPVVLGVRTFPNWDFPVVADTGEINLPIPRSLSDGGHAICVVGYETRPNAPGGGVLIFRNSWGKAWAPQSRYRAGYGTLFFEYVRLYAVAAYA